MAQSSYPADNRQGSNDIDPGSMGQMTSSGAGYSGSGDGYGQSGFEEELPLLVELGIDFNLIKQKVCFVCIVLNSVDSCYMLASSAVDHCSFAFPYRLSQY